ncbi:hypothetical protein BBK14_30700 [Parafrankia soli]|uniref:Uncharacterized protein n=1 Tax=Parafrankia soli TaxID=2599596 RepID=A0A1S1RDI3_9ACTN|nr:tetratricopeptide repeat protein [Parafrankia soli]OHV44773.1 hypothetical protein BBK14_30700 [Parafrankia soli]
MADEDQPGGSGDDAGALYAQANDLHRRGRPEEALAVLDRLLRDDPDHVAARYARAICLVDVGRPAEAPAQLRRVLDSEPGHYEAAYRLGRLLQADGDVEGAAEAYRQVLTVTPFQDTPARLRACENALATTRLNHPPGPTGGANTPVVDPGPGSASTPGPPTLRSRLDAQRVADRGRPVRSVSLKARHLIPSIGKVFLIAAVANIIFVVVAATSGGGGGMAIMFIFPFVAISLVGILFFPVWVFVKSRTNGADFYEYGVEIKSGFVRRSIQFVWYYQIAEAPTYVRSFANYFTNTASLRIHYNSSAATTVERVEIAGFGSPDEVKWIGGYLESRVPPERIVIRGPWT